jgi:hypothetical protein
MQHPNPLLNQKSRTIKCWWCGERLGQVVKKFVTPDGREEQTHKYCARVFNETMESTPC